MILESSYKEKWEKFIQSRLDEALAPENYYFGKSFGSIADIEEIKFGGDKLPDMPFDRRSRILENQKKKAFNTLTEHFVSPNKEEDYNLLTRFFTENFNSNSFEYLKFLLSLFAEAVEEYWNIKSRDKIEIRDILVSWVSFIQKNEAQDENFAKLPMEWKIEMARKSEVEL